MNRIPPLLLAFAATSAQAIAALPRALEGDLALGAGIGAQRYAGNLGDEGSVYGRLQAQYHPTEWLGTRMVFGFGNVGNGDAKPTFATEGFCHLGMDLVLQPSLGLGAWRPFAFSGLATTIGTAQVANRPPFDLDGNLYVPLGAGLELPLSDRWSVWAQLETYLVMAEGDRIDGVSSGEGYFEKRDELQRIAVGASWTFGNLLPGGASHTHETRAARLPGDADGDGVADAADRCPQTPAGSVVDAQGCPADSDRDGIPDLLDDCPSTPIGNRVDEFGCTVGNDKDHDGVPDAADRCPGTARGATVDATGCPVAVAAKAATDSDKDGVPDNRDLCPNTPGTAKADADGCPVATAPEPSTDTDKDGVPDNRDLCSNTPGTAKADADGCPIPPPPTEDASPAKAPDQANKAAATPAPGSSVPAVSAVTQAPGPGSTTPLAQQAVATKPTIPGSTRSATTTEKDSDRDGVPDSRDLCRSTPRGSKVDSTGCSTATDPEADSDKDGVRDVGDLCPNSKYGMKVDATGCQILSLEKGSQAILEGVQFQSGTARLLEESLPVLEHLARVLKRNPARVEIAGFTERRGPEGENISLSLRRAEAVKDHLTTLGTDPGRISVRGYGSAEPIADNAVEAGRLRNRRIEVRVR